jgi:hypothetical protein
VAAAMGASGVDALLWNWKECTLLRVYEAYEFCLTLRAPRSDKSAERPSEGGFEGIEKVFAAVGLGSGAQPQPARRGMLSQDLFESPSGAQSCKSRRQMDRKAQPHHRRLLFVRSRWQGEKNAPLKNLPYPFPGFGPRDNSEQEQIPFPPSPAVPEESAGGHNDEEEDEGGTVVEVEDDGEEEEEEEEEIIRSIPGQARNHHRSPAVHPTAFRALASLFPAATHSHFVTLPEGAACHPRAHLPSPSRVPLRHHRARAPQPASRRRRIAQAMRRQRPLLHHLLVAPPLRPSLPLRLCRALRMYAACPCPHAIQLPQVAANAPRQHQVLFPLHQRAVFRPGGHDKRSRGTVGSCVIALARKSYRSLTARMTAHPAFA